MSGEVRRSVEARPLDRSTGGASTLTSAQEYGYEDTGPITGSYTLDPSRPVLRTSPVIVTSPSAIPPGYEEPLSGSIASLPPGNYVVRGYLMTDAEYLQAEAPVSPQGTWSLELRLQGPIGVHPRLRPGVDAHEGRGPPLEHPRQLPRLPVHGRVLHLQREIGR